MEFRFNADEWKLLRPMDRVRRCRLWAAQAHRIAADSKPPVSKVYEDLARQWSLVAQELERDITDPPRR